jgi:hypothetical protein
MGARWVTKTSQYDAEVGRRLQILGIILPRSLDLLRPHNFTERPQLKYNNGQTLALNTKTLAARGLEEHVRITLIFSRIISFMVFTVFPIANLPIHERTLRTNFSDSVLCIFYL